MNKLNKIIAAVLVTFSLQSFAEDCPALSGELTIGTSEGSNFSSISEAVAALKCGGVEGPVTFYIESGTYPERVAFSRISGSSAFNSIRFASQSGISSDVVISSIKSDATMVLIGSSHITFENITIEHKDATYGNCMRVEGETNDLHFKKVVFNGVEMVRTGATNATVYFTPVLKPMSLSKNVKLIMAAWGSAKAELAYPCRILKLLLWQLYFSIRTNRVLRLQTSTHR
jgi:hypothetical protein